MPRDAIQKSFNSVTAVASGFFPFFFFFCFIRDEAKNVSRRCVISVQGDTLLALTTTATFSRTFRGTDN